MFAQSKYPGREGVMESRTELKMEKLWVGDYVNVYELGASWRGGRVESAAERRFGTLLAFPQKKLRPPSPGTLFDNAKTMPILIDR